MLFIIMHHAVVHGGGLGMEPCTNRWIAYLFYPGGKICFDAFICISAWFLADGRFKAERFVKGWLEVLLYSVATTLAAVILGAQLSGWEIFSAFLPITGGVQGYAQTYLAFYLLMPLLSKVSANMTKKQNQYTLLVLSIFVFLSRFMSFMVWSEQSAYSRLGLFIFIYFIMLYFKRNPLKILSNTAAMLIVFLFSWGALFGISVAGLKFPELGVWKYISILNLDEGGVLNLLGGISFFFFFNSIRMPSVKFINYIGGTTFAVILIHDGHFFRNWTWSLVRSTEWFYSPVYFLLVPLCAVCIYAVCAVIDLLRKRFLERPLFRAKWMQALCQSIDRIVGSDPAGLPEQGEPELSADSSQSQQIETLSRELSRKDRALAEIAARYILKEDEQLFHRKD